MAARKPLKDNELVLLAFMHDYFSANHQLPSSRATAEAMKWTCPKTSMYHFRKLAAKGYIERNDAGKYRFANGRAFIMAPAQGAGQ